MGPFIIVTMKRIKRLTVLNIVFMAILPFLCVKLIQYALVQGSFQSSIFSRSIAVDDPQLVHYLKTRVLQPPLPVHYNLQAPFAGPEHEGSQQRVLDLFENQTHGIFLETGANDGETSSTTFMLERDFAWTGLLMEVDDVELTKLRSKNRMAWTAGACFSTSMKPQIVTLQRHQGTGLKRLAYPGAVQNGWIPSATMNTSVTCFPFYSMILALNMSAIDFLSLDAHGTELEVLKTIPFDKVTIGVISVVVHQDLITSSHNEIQNLLQRRGYEMVGVFPKENRRTYIYVRSDL